MRKYLPSSDNNMKNLRCGSVVTSPQVQVGIYYTDNWTLCIAVCGRRCCMCIFTAVPSFLSDRFPLLSFARGSSKSFRTWAFRICCSIYSVTKLRPRCPPAIRRACHPHFPSDPWSSGAHTRVSQFPIPSLRYCSNRQYCSSLSLHVVEKFLIFKESKWSFKSVQPILLRSSFIFSFCSLMLQILVQVPLLYHRQCSSLCRLLFSLSLFF